ncbi:MAG: RimK family alpha-L-glutamate ligase [Candidatus Nanohaloarchaea archaeon]
MRISIAGTDRQEEEDAIMAELEDRRHDAEFIDPADVSYLLTGGELTVRYRGQSLNDLDLLYMRRTRFDVEASRDLVAAATTLGIPTVEKKDVFFNPLSKFYSLLSFVGASVEDVEIPATAVVRDAGEAGPIAGAISYPLIVKPVSGREGEGVTRIDNREELEAALDDVEFPVLLQEYIEIEEEYRVLVVGDDPLGTAVKQAEEGADARNYAQGAEFTAVDTPAVERAAVAIADLMEIEVAGVDIVEAADGTLYEIECNRCPQFEGFAAARPDVDVPRRIVDYLEGRTGT